MEARLEAEDGSWCDVAEVKYHRVPGREPRSHVVVLWESEEGEAVVPNRRTNLRPQSQLLDTRADAAARLLPGTPVVAGPQFPARSVGPNVEHPPQPGRWYDAVIVRAPRVGSSFLVRFADPLPPPSWRVRRQLLSEEQWRRNRPAIEPREQWVPWGEICERFVFSALEPGASQAPVALVATVSAEPSGQPAARERSGRPLSSPGNLSDHGSAPELDGSSSCSSSSDGSD